MTSLVHLGDFHASPGPRNADRYRALDQVIREGIALPRLGGWLWPGDLDHARMGIDDKNALSVRVQLMAQYAPVFIAYGNHDLKGDLDFLALLEAKHSIHVIDTPKVVRDILATDERVAIFVFPYPTKGGLVADDVMPGSVIDEASLAIDAIFAEAGRELADYRLYGGLTLAMGHVNVSGAITSTGQPNIGREIELSQSHIDRLGKLYFGLNHIHKAQSICGADYAGSICRLDWGEIDPKGYIVVEYGEANAGGALFEVRRPPIDVAPLYHVEAELTRDGFFWQATNGPDGPVVTKPESWRGCEVRVRYKFKQSEKSVISDAALLAEFAEASRLEVEPIAVPDRALRSPEVAAARTLQEKVGAWCKVDGSTASDGLLAKLARLEYGDHQQLLTEVQSGLEAGA